MDEMKYHTGGFLQYIEEQQLKKAKFNLKYWIFDEPIKQKESKIMKWLKKKIIKWLGFERTLEDLNKQYEEINELRRRINDGAYMCNVYSYYGAAPSVRTMVELILNHLKLNPTLKRCESHYELKPYPKTNGKTNTSRTPRKRATKR